MDKDKPITGADILLEDFQNWLQEQYKDDIVHVEKSDNPDTFKSIFGTSFVESEEN